MSPVKPIVVKVMIAMLIGLLSGLALNEIAFALLHETSRAPKIIELVIPKGTAEQVARGESPPTIPKSMFFVVGDTLVLKNNDSVHHELGPLWIPSGSSASLTLNDAQTYAFSCSFQPRQTFGLNVQEALTTTTRLYGLLLSGVPAGIMFALYTLVMPARKKPTESLEEKKNDLQKNV
jgi:hypothetical protein